jgi:hypothetical protein
VRARTHTRARSTRICRRAREYVRARNSLLHTTARRGQLNTAMARIKALHVVVWVMCLLAGVEGMRSTVFFGGGALEGKCTASYTEPRPHTAACAEPSKVGSSAPSTHLDPSDTEQFSRLGKRTFSTFSRDLGMLSGAPFLFVGAPRSGPLLARVNEASANACARKAPTMQYAHGDGTNTFVRRWEQKDAAGVGTKVYPLEKREPVSI